LATLHTAGGLRLNDHCGSFQPRLFYDDSMMMKKYCDLHFVFGPERY